MKECDKLALLGGPKVKTTPYGTGSKHDADVEADALRARMKAGPLPLAMGPSVRELGQFRQFRGHHIYLFGVVPVESRGGAAG